MNLVLKKREEGVKRLKRYLFAQDYPYYPECYFKQFDYKDNQPYLNFAK